MIKSKEYLGRLQFLYSRQLLELGPQDGGHGSTYVAKALELEALTAMSRGPNDHMEHKDPTRVNHGMV